MFILVFVTIKNFKKFSLQISDSPMFGLYNKSFMPLMFRLLCNTVVYYKDVGEDYVKYNSHNQVNIFV